jgi:hypothetical protein
MSVVILCAELGADGFLLRFDRAEPPVFHLANNSFKKIVGREFREFDEQQKLWQIDAKARPELEQFIKGASAWLCADVRRVGKDELCRSGRGESSGFGVLFDAGLPI